MKAAILKKIGSPLIIEDVPSPKVEGQALVRVLAAGLNRRDYFITQGQYAQIVVPAILGSDACGECEGRLVLIQPGFRWGSSDEAQNAKYNILGMPSQGTLSEYVSVPYDHLYGIPEHLTIEEGAAVPLAGLTAYRAVVSKAQVSAGDHVLVTGIGGGVALLAAQMCLAIGAKVFVTSSDQQKIDAALKLGCAAGINYKESGWGARLFSLSSGINKVIDGSAGSEFNEVMDALKPAGRVVIYGGTAGKMTFSPQKLFWKQIQILGTTMGTPDEFVEMLAFLSEHKIKPIIDRVYPLKDINVAISRLAQQDQFGKIIIRIGDQA